MNALQHVSELEGEVAEARFILDEQIRNG